jgi:hypothetical protein
MENFIGLFNDIAIEKMRSATGARNAIAPVNMLPHNVNNPTVYYNTLIVQNAERLNVSGYIYKGVKSHNAHITFDSFMNYETPGFFTPTAAIASIYDGYNTQTCQGAQTVDAASSLYCFEIASAPITVLNLGNAQMLWQFANLNVVVSDAEWGELSSHGLVVAAGSTRWRTIVSYAYRVNAAGDYERQSYFDVDLFISKKVEPGMIGGGVYGYYSPWSRNLNPGGGAFHSELTLFPVYVRDSIKRSLDNPLDIGYISMRIRAFLQERHILYKWCTRLGSGIDHCTTNTISIGFLQSWYYAFLSFYFDGGRPLPQAVFDYANSYINVNSTIQAFGFIQKLEPGVHIHEDEYMRRLLRVIITQVAGVDYTTGLERSNHGRLHIMRKYIFAQKLLGISAGVVAEPLTNHDVRMRFATLLAPILYGLFRVDENTTTYVGVGVGQSVADCRHMVITHVYFRRMFPNIHGVISSPHLNVFTVRSISPTQLTGVALLRSFLYTKVFTNRNEPRHVHIYVEMLCFAMLYHTTTDVGHMGATLNELLRPSPLGRGLIAADVDWVTIEGECDDANAVGGPTQRVVAAPYVILGLSAYIMTPHALDHLRGGYGTVWFLNANIALWPVLHHTNPTLADGSIDWNAINTGVTNHIRNMAIDVYDQLGMLKPNSAAGLRRASVNTIHAAAVNAISDDYVWRGLNAQPSAVFARQSNDFAGIWNDIVRLSA